MRHTPTKQRSSSCYQNKINKITKWYERLMKFREKEIINPNTKQPTKRKELKSLDWYLEKIVKPRGDK